MKKALSTAGLLYIFAIIVTAALYAIDTDPPYANKWHTYTEFAIISVIIMSFLTSLAGVVGIFYYIAIRPLVRRAKGVR